LCKSSFSLPKRNLNSGEPSGDKYDTPSFSLPKRNLNEEQPEEEEQETELSVCQRGI